MVFHWHFKFKLFCVEKESWESTFFLFSLLFAIRIKRVRIMVHCIWWWRGDVGIFFCCGYNKNQGQPINFMVGWVFSGCLAYFNLKVISFKFNEIRFRLRNECSAFVYRMRWDEMRVGFNSYVQEKRQEANERWEKMNKNKNKEKNK